LFAIAEKLFELVEILIGLVETTYPLVEQAWQIGMESHGREDIHPIHEDSIRGNDIHIFARSYQNIGFTVQSNERGKSNAMPESRQ
jgi:hypothetical protein